MSKEMAARLKQKQQQDSKRERKTARILGRNFFFNFVINLK